MKKSTLIALTDYFESVDVPATIADAVNELFAERAKNEEKAEANRAVYASAHDAVMAVITTTPQTVAEIFEACEDDLPNNFSKSKVQYGLLHQWADEVKVIVNVKGANQYVLA